MFPMRPALAILTFAALLLLAAQVRKDFRGLSWALANSLLDFRPLRPLPEPEIVLPPKHFVRPNAHLDDSGGTLDHFYAALARTERKLGVTRILHYGDSPTTGDLITGDTRSLLQNHYGSAGHGFTLIGKPWAWYQHWGVELSASGWDIRPATHPDLRDGAWGLGGVAFLSSSSARSRITLRDRPDGSIEISYLRQPGGGRITVACGDGVLGEIDTSADTRTQGFSTFELPKSPGPIELRASGQVRVFGAIFERPGPGIVYDTIGLNGAFTTLLARIFEEAQWREHLRHRNPDLVIINYGTNESGFTAYVDYQYEKELRAAIRRLRAALPEASLLIMSPLDRGTRSGGEIRTIVGIPKLISIQQRVARETGCGFYNTFDAAGGEGTMGRWYEGHPRLVAADFIHVTPQGARKVGEQFVRALELGFSQYKLREVQQQLKLARRNP